MEFLRDLRGDLAETWRDTAAAKNVRVFWMWLYMPVRVVLYLLIIVSGILILTGGAVVWPLSKAVDWLWARFPKKRVRTIFLKEEG